MVNCTRESTWAWHFLFCKLSVFSTCHYPCTQRWWWGEELAQLMTEGEKERDSPAAIWRLQKAGDVFHFTSTGLRSRNDYVDPSSRADINCSSASYKEMGGQIPPSLPSSSSSFSCSSGPLTVRRMPPCTGKGDLLEVSIQMPIII